MRISKDLYGTDSLSTPKLANGYTRPVSAGDFPASISSEILRAHDDLLTRHKINFIYAQRLHVIFQIVQAILSKSTSKNSLKKVESDGLKKLF